MSIILSSIWCFILSIVNLTFALIGIVEDSIWLTCVNMFATGFCFCGSISCFLAYILNKRGYKE